MWYLKPLANKQHFGSHCQLGAHLSRHIRDAAGLRVGIGPVASRLALTWPDLPGAVAGPNQGEPANPEFGTPAASTCAASTLTRGRISERIIGDGLWRQRQKERH